MKPDKSHHQEISPWINSPPCTSALPFVTDASAPFSPGNTSVSIGFQADRSAVGLNAPLGLTVVGRNDSSTRVKAMHIEIRQLSKWTARGSHNVVVPEKHSRTIASIVVPESELGALQRPEKDEGRHGQSAAAGAAGEDLEQQLAAGGGTRYELWVPGDALLTLQAETFEVSHTLSLWLETGGTSTSAPEVSTPLLVHPGEASLVSEGHLEEVAIAPVSGQAEAFATLMEMRTDGRMKPVVVPQSAVIATYKNELPSV